MVSPTDPGVANEGGNSAPGGPGTIFRSGAKFTVPASNTIFPSASRFPVLAECEAKVSLAEKFRPNSAATLGSSTSVRIYHTFFPLPLRWPK